MSEELNESDYYNSVDVAKMLGIHPQNVTEMARSNRIPDPVRRPRFQRDQKGYLWDKDVIDEWITRRGESYTIKDLANMLDRAVPTIHAWHRRGCMPEPDGKIGKSWAWHKDTIIPWIEENLEVEWETDDE